MSVPHRPSRPWTDREQTRTYRAEHDWVAACVDEAPLRTLDECEALLRELVHPVLADRCELEVLRDRGVTDGQLVYLEWYQFRMQLVLPCPPSVLVHEVAHLLLESMGGCDIHDAQFRATMVWLVRRRYGKRRADRLARIYAHHGLATFAPAR